MKPPISSWRFLYVWSKRQLRIKANTLSYAFSFRKKKKEEVRSGTHSKRKSGFILQALMLGVYIFLAFNMSWQTLMRLDKVIPNTGPKSEIVYIDFFAYSELQYIEKDVEFKKDKSPEKSLSTIRKELLSEEVILLVGENHPVQKKVSRNEKVLESLREGLLSDNKLSRKQAEEVLDSYINEGFNNIKERELRSSSFTVDFSDDKSPEFLKWIGLYFLLCLFALSLIEGIGNKNPLMMAPEDDLENLAVFPIKVWILFLLPLLQRTFFNVMSILVSFPPTVCFLIVLGHGKLESVLLALPISFIFCLCTASLQICYQFLGRYNSRKWLRAFCSYMQLPGYAIFCLVLMGGQLKPLLGFLRDFALVDPGSFMPSAMMLSFIHQGNTTGLWQPILIMAAFPLAALTFIHLYSKGGLPSLPQESAKNRSGAVSVTNQPQCALRLTRDRNYFIQTVIFPIMLFSFYLFMFMDKSSGINGVKALSMLFGAASFILLGSVLNIAAHEGPSLWLLFSASKNISDILKKSVHFWLKLVIVFYLIGLGIMFSLGLEDMPILKSISLIFGLPSIAYIAASLSFSAYSPPSGNEPQKPKTSIIYFYMLLASMFAQSVLFGMPGSEISGPILFGFLAYALWQDNKRTINYYMDPDYLPPRELSAKNSMIWCILFFGAQSIVFMIVFMTNQNASLLTMTISNVIASVIIAGAAAYWYRKGILPSIEFKNRSPVSKEKIVGAVSLCAVVFIGFAWLYLKFLKATFPDLPYQTLDADDRIYFFILAVVSAPLIEEYLFRRLLLVALLRNLSPKIAIISCALIFAAVHPITSFPPVFCLGLGASWIYWKSGSLWAPIALHAIYNAGVLVLQ